MLKKQAGESLMADKIASESQYIELKKSLGLDLPIFYFSLDNVATSDTLYKVIRNDDRKNLARMSNEYGNWQEITNFYKKTKELYNAIYTTKKDSINELALIELKNESNILLRQYSNDRIIYSLDRIDTLAANIPSLAHVKTKVAENRKQLITLNNNATKWKTYIPKISWYGLNNQYHNWIRKFIVGDFGISFQDSRPIKNKIGDAIGWTMLLNFIAIIITYIIAIPLGVYSACNKGSFPDRFSTTVLFMLYSLPNFWIGTMLLVFLCNPDYLAWFPTFGVGTEGDFFNQAWHLVLPVFCLVYPSFAFLSRQMRGAMLTVLNQDYIRTAKAKGLSDKIVVWKHSLKNSLLPIITLFANIFPLAISGSFVIELIFNLPGMGKLSLDAINARDYPMVFTVMMFSSILTLIGYLVSDILYAAVDPRISFSKK